MNKSAKSPFLDIPQLNTRIPLSDEINYIGKQTFREANAKMDASFGFSPISRIKKDPHTNQIVKEQFIIQKKKGQYYIQDLHSTNGTYLGNINLKKNPPQILHEGSEIIVPVEQKGKLIQLKLYFRTSPISHPNIANKSSQKTPPKKIPSFQDTQFKDPTAIPTLDPVDNDLADLGTGAAKYYDPTYEPTVSPPENQKSPKAVIYSSIPPESSTKSFILVRKKVKLPKNAFDPKISPKYGLDLSMFYKLNWKEVWHILIAYFILVLMIYRTNINIMVITASILYGFSNLGNFLSDIFLDPLPAAFTFGVVFVVHELSHLYTGKSQNFPSRFCLLERGVKLSLLAAILGIPIALPGAAVSLGIDPQKDETKMGRIKIAGPLSNFLFGWICYLVGWLLFTMNGINFSQFFFQGAIFNFTLGMFNMIPKEFGSFALDGKFIFKWKKGYYFGLLLGLGIGYGSTLIRLI